MEYISLFRHCLPAETTQLKAIFRVSHAVKFSVDLPTWRWRHMKQRPCWLWREVSLPASYLPLGSGFL